MLHMEEASVEEDVTTEKAIEALTDHSIGFEKSAEGHKLPPINMESVKKEEGLFWDKEVDADSWEVDEAIETMYEFITSWADERGYEVVVEDQAYFSEPIDEELLLSLRGYIDTDGKEIDFFYKGRDDIRFKYGGDTRFDGTMTDEYREIYSLTETVAERFGEIETKYPDL
jgi:hypothetical protein